MKIFFDTNIFVYAFDAKEGRKYSNAQKLIREVANDISSEAYISYQVIQEFCNVALKRSFDTDLIKAAVADLLWPLAKNAKDIASVEFYNHVIALHTEHALSFYDACIVQAALDLGCDTLYSEDLQNGQYFNGLKIVNPFTPGK